MLCSRQHRAATTVERRSWKMKLDMLWMKRTSDGICGEKMKKNIHTQQQQESREKFLGTWRKDVNFVCAQIITETMLNISPKNYFHFIWKNFLLCRSLYSTHNIKVAWLFAWKCEEAHKDLKWVCSWVRRKGDVIHHSFEWWNVRRLCRAPMRLALFRFSTLTTTFYVEVLWKISFELVLLLASFMCLINKSLLLYRLTAVSTAGWMNMYVYVVYFR